MMMGRRGLRRYRVVTRVFRPKKKKKGWKETRIGVGGWILCWIVTMS